MARNRMIRPEFWEDSKIASLRYPARLLFIALWNFADDEGYLPCDFKWLKAKCLPYDKLGISEFINELVAAKRIEIKNEIIHIKNFLKYQRIDKPKESELSVKFAEHSKNDTGIVQEHSTTKEKLREVKGSKEKEREVEVKENGETSTHASPFKEQKQNTENLTAQLVKTIGGRKEPTFEEKKANALRQAQALEREEANANNLP